MAEWKFRVMRPSEQNKGPTEAEFFRRETAVTSLVRESVQNSLDAAVNGDPVRVRFVLRTARSQIAPGGASEHPWLAGLGVHIEACKDAEPEDANIARESLSYLVIEDFNTRGLRGNPEGARKEELGNGQQDFYYFWRNVGRTGKKSSKLGSWGLGKAVYSSSSRAGVVLGWTVRDDRRSLLMGQAVLEIHDLADSSGRTQQHDAYGFYGEFGQRPDDPDFAHPTEDGSVIAKFRADFSLARTDETGLSLVIPMPKDGLVPGDTPAQGVAAYMRELIDQFAYPLLDRKLTVEVDVDGTSAALDAANLDAALDSIELAPEALATTRKYVELCRWALSDPVAFKLTRQDSVAATWEQLAISDGDLVAARMGYHAQQPLAFEIPVLVRMKPAAETETRFHCFLRHDPSVKKSVVSFVRQGLTLTEISGVVQSGVIGLVLVVDDNLARLLRAAENPAHTKWIARGERVIKEFTGGGERVRVVEQAPRVILKRILGAGQDKDVELLAAFFPDPDSTGVTPEEDTGKKRGRKRQKRFEPPKPRRRPLRMSRIDGGFEVVRQADVALASPEIVVDVAFDCISGNPFKAWAPFDFDLAKAPINIEIVGGVASAIDGNRMRVRIESDDFRLRVRGFGTTRDVAVKFRFVTEAVGVDLGHEEAAS